jgi:hypothetical protein
VNEPELELLQSAIHEIQGTGKYTLWELIQFVLRSWIIGLGVPTSRNLEWCLMSLWVGDRRKEDSHTPWGNISKHEIDLGLWRQEGYLGTPSFKARGLNQTNYKP